MIAAKVMHSNSFRAYCDLKETGHELYTSDCNTMLCHHNVVLSLRSGKFLQNVEI